MKKTTVFTLAAVCGAFVLALPDWKQPLNAAYPTAQFTLTNAEMTQTLAVQGCKTLSIKKTKTGPSTLNSMTLYNNGSFAWYRYATGGTNGVPTTSMTGSWSTADNKTFYLQLNTASMGLLFDELESAGLANCQVKYPAMTQLDILAPTATTVSKNYLKVTVKKGIPIVAGTLQFKGKQHNDEKGVPNAVGTFSLKATLKGGSWVQI